MSSNRHSDWDIACKVYIGGLSRDATKYDLEDAFGKYGGVRNVWVARQPPGKPSLIFFTNARPHSKYGYEISASPPRFLKRSVVA